MVRKTQKKPIKNNNSSKKSLLYLATPVYGGWVTMTAHLVLKYNYLLYKVSSRTETNSRDFGYNVKYRNISKEELKNLNNILITAIDKHYYPILEFLPKNVSIVIHDPTEVKTSTKNPNPLLKYLPKMNIITIRESVKNYLLENHHLKSTFVKHPFFEYSIPRELIKKSNFAVSISRIDFDKNIEIILEANQLIKDSNRRVVLFGAENRLYTYHKLKPLGFKKYYKGKFNKTLPASIQGNNNLLNGVRFVVDLSVIKNDGGGTQYTFLEAIHQNCCLILHKKWINQKGSIFRDKYNCLVIETPEELASILSRNINTKSIIQNAKKILKSHTQIKW